MPNNNDAIIARIKGIPGQVGTSETDADSRNPNVQPVPKLVMGHIEVMGPDGSEGIPYDEAVIHLEGDEDSEINVHCPGALRLAPFIVKAVNAWYDVEALRARIAELEAK